MKRYLPSALLLCSCISAFAAVPLRPGPRLLCHRTANQDVPENTLESLEQAALLGCDMVEIDLRRTLDGDLILNHDGFLERLTDGTGTAEDSFYGELAISDAGSWMGRRFAGLRPALFDDALRLARTLGVDLILDLKTPGIGPEVLQALAREGMLERVQFNGEWDDVKRLRPEAHDAGKDTAWVRAGVTPEEVARLHNEGKAVVANFSDSAQEMDLDAMKAAVRAGVDAINVDYPLLGAEAVGRPVAAKLRALIAHADAGDSSTRSTAILQLAHLQGFPILQPHFAQWLLDPDAHVSRAAALALVQARPATPYTVFLTALHSLRPSARANAAWAIGRLTPQSSSGLALLFPLLSDSDAHVRAEAYLAVSHIPGSVPEADLRRGLTDVEAHVRGAAALALAEHWPHGAAQAIASQLHREMEGELQLYRSYLARQPQRLSPEEIASVTGSYRCQMQMVRALSLMQTLESTRALEDQAFRPGQDFSQMNAIVAAFALWERVGDNPQVTIRALASEDHGVADRAEWILLKAGPAVQPALQKALRSSDANVRVRAERILHLQSEIAQ